MVGGVGGVGGAAVGAARWVSASAPTKSGVELFAARWSRHLKALTRYSPRVYGSIACMQASIASGDIGSPSSSCSANRSSCIRADSRCIAAAGLDQSSPGRRPSPNRLSRICGPQKYAISF
ncbi:MAG: hypothetical protein C0485_17750 [Pirellula sp.]|nr:hypothetical protein [Pirellula sp.]